MINPYASTFMIATRLDHPRLSDFDAPIERTWPARRQDGRPPEGQRRR
jgi:hypothetical protein